MNNPLPYGASTYSKSVVAFGPDFPVRATHADGWRVFVDGNDLCDMVMGLGSVILGHRHPAVDEAVRRQLAQGLTFSLGSRIEAEAAERVLQHFPADCMLQWGVNGSDATLGAIRLARLVTGRNTIVLASDGYHGFHDWSLMGTPRGSGIPLSGGWDVVRIPADASVEYLQDAPREYIAAVIVEPDEHSTWLQPLRELCSKSGALLIFDEVMTWGRYPGFRAAKHYGVEPDLTCIGKSLANGMPCSAIVGSTGLLARFCPHRVWTASMSEKPKPLPNAFLSMTWGGHPLSMAAVIATLDVLEHKTYDGGATACSGYERLWARSVELNTRLNDRISVPSPIAIGPPPWNRVQARSEAHMRWFRRSMLQHGVLIYAAHNLSLAHDEAAWERLLGAWKLTLNSIPDELPVEEDHAASIMRR